MLKRSRSIGGSSDAPAAKKARQVKAKYAANPAKAVFVRGVRTIGNGNAIETKNQDTTLSMTNFGTAAPICQDLLAAIAQGDGNGNRDGQRIVLKSVDCIINFTGISGASTTDALGVPVFCTWALVLDQSPNGSSAAAADIFTTNASNLTFGYTPSLDRFQVLRRGQITLNRVSNVSEIVQFHVPLNITTRFADGTGAPQTNGLYLVILGTGPAAGSTAFSSSCAYRVRVKFQG